MPQSFEFTDEQLLALRSLLELVHYDDLAAAPLSSHGTSGGIQLTDDLVDQLSREAEEGFEIGQLRPR